MRTDGLTDKNDYRVVSLLTKGSNLQAFNPISYLELFNLDIHLFTNTLSLCQGSAATHQPRLSLQFKPVWML